MSHGSALDLVDAFYRAYNSRDAAAAAALYREDAWHQEGTAGPRRTGRAALESGLSGFFSLLPDAHWERRETIPAGSTVAVVYTLTGHLGIDMGGAQTKGRPIRLDGVHLIELDGDSIAGTRDYWSLDDFKRQARGEAA
ncbi:nuclear transport factor 2 family protein [Chthonobacter albigriseus]|uniref:nuclear transport factor 2 family protein n=1 Tax=Chthonobacter albigriseus TaxID=1683161 RepID=UPI0015EFC838|nr:nuclear transport factor 2 family protein [Chthonobacter albigriseus]